mgnify:CR=1 FL=1
METLEGLNLEQNANYSNAIGANQQICVNDVAKSSIMLDKVEPELKSQTRSETDSIGKENQDRDKLESVSRNQEECGFSVISKSASG